MNITPTLAEVSPEWKRLSDKVRELSERRDAIHDELKEIDARQQRRASRIPSPISFGQRAADLVIEKPTPRPSEQALKLIGDDTLLPQESEPRPESTDAKAKRVVQYRHPDDKRAAELSAELTAVEEALAFLHPQWARAHRDGSRQLCALLSDEYQTVVDRLTQALMEVGNALIAHRDFVAAVARQGADPMWLRQVDAISLQEMFGDPKDSSSAIRRLLGFAAEIGRFDRDQLPDEWTLTPDQHRALTDPLPAPAAPAAAEHKPAATAAEGAPEPAPRSKVAPLFKIVRRAPQNGGDGKSVVA